MPNQHRRRVVGVVLAGRARVSSLELKYRPLMIFLARIFYANLIALTLQRASHPAIAHLTFYQSV